MTSKLKCPICGGDIQYNDSYSTYDCKNNPSEHYASEEVWQALIESHKSLVLSEQSADREIHRLRDLLSQSQKDLQESHQATLTNAHTALEFQKDLEIARKALEEIANADDDVVYDSWCATAMRGNASIALKQIEHKE